MFVSPHKNIFDSLKENDSNILNEEDGIETIDYNSLVEITNIFEECVDNDDITLSEAFADNPNNSLVKNFKERLDSVADLKNQWKKLTKSMVTHKWITRYIDKKQEDMIMKYLDIMKKEDVKYGEYRKAFCIICKFFGLPNKGVVIEWLEVQQKKNEGKTLACRYSKGISRVNIPENIRLTHFSPEDKLTELEPTFKSKTAGKFFYDSSRVYFTIKEKLDPFKFGVARGSKRICYQTDDYIPVAYIDPTYILFRDRCCYIDTQKPIKVHRVGTAGLFGIKKDK